MSDLATKLTSSLRPGLVGLDPDQFKTRLADWLCDAEKEVVSIQQSEVSRRTKAITKYVEYLFYKDAVMHHLDSAERVEVDREGSVDMGDWAARMRGLKLERDGALADFEALLVEPEQAAPKDDKGASFFMLNEYVW